MSLDSDIIAQQLTLLATHRRTLAHLLEQAAQYGGEVFAPPQTANGIAEARANISRVKKYLRASGVQVEDGPNDKAPRRRKPMQAHQAGDVVSGDKVGGDKVGGDKVMGDKRTINTEGGDYAEGTIDKRQGTFIGQQIIQSVLAPALHQLRAPVGDFVGRTAEIDQLVQAFTKGGGAAISGIRGMGGIGKTELAYVVAQRLTDQFPDAQLLVELRGASATPLTPEQVLQIVIRAFEREAKLTDDLSQLKTIYSSVLTGKRVLILADDAKDAAQVRPLLPPPGCALLVTSRARFSLPGMTALDLGTLPPQDAEKLVQEICPRIGERTAELARLCGYLVLALRVSASLLASRGSRRVEDYLNQLSDERTKLAQLRDPRDRELDVGASLQLSFDVLEEAAKAILLQLSVFPTSFDLEAAQNVVTVPPDKEIADVLEDLCLLSLLDWDEKVQRFSLHALVRAFALARLEDADDVWLRYAQYYAGIAEYAQFELYLKREVLAGLALFDQERAHIDAAWEWARERAGNPQADELLLQFPNAVYHIADLRYEIRHERIPQLEAHLAAAQRLKRKREEGTALGNLGLAYTNLGDSRRAIAFCEQYLALARELGDRQGESSALGGLGNAYASLGETGRAIVFYEQWVAIARHLGDREGEGSALGGLGLAYTNLGDSRRAIAFCEQWVAIACEIGDRQGEALASWNLGQALEKQGDLAEAAAAMQICVDFERAIGHPDAEADAAYLEQLRQRLADGKGGLVLEEQGKSLGHEAREDDAE